jgi:protein-S-isoprenylcysteine O-methyltransferase Ste14
LAKLAAMKLVNHCSHSGRVLFRWRSYLPLVLLPFFALSLRDASYPFGSHAWDQVRELGCLALSLAGLAVRIYTIGTAPEGTSERSTVDPRASQLNTAGIYSVVRHPLYIGNTLIALGLALVPGPWYLPVIVLLASLLYHERIAAHEEAFLEATFGDLFRDWADRVPAMIPSLRDFRPSLGLFNWRRVFGREFHGLFVIGAGFFVLDLLRDRVVTGRWQLDPVWTWFCLATGLLFVVLTTLKRFTSLFRVEQ